MTTIQFLTNVLTWLNADPAHPVLAASVIAMLTPTPKPGTWYAQAYKIVDIVALNLLHAKSTGVKPADIAEQVAALLAAKSGAPAAQTAETEQSK